ncbi:MAG TPA: Ig-like domain-containing protein [Anaerovoracaceae bacterium]|nr:Ig-like domain-containing protein [Anaerovoracaceae bacterium]
MKRLGRVVCLSIMIVLMSVNVSLASGLTLVDSFPEEGKSNLNPQNIAIKLVFSDKISDPDSIAANAKKFSITDDKGKAIAFEPLYNEDKYPNEVWLQIEQTLEQNSSYHVKILEGLKSDAGNSLEEPVTLNFATRNTEADSKGYMMLMMIMIGGMVIFTVVDSRRKEKKDTTQKSGTEKVNPYKEARRTGKSVEEVVAKTKKEKAQAERRKAKVAKRRAANGEEERTPSRPGVKRVMRARTISEKGYATPQSFIDNRIAREQAEARKAKEKQKRQTKSKGSKQQQRRKK